MEYFFRNWGVGVELMDDAQIRMIDKQSGNTMEFPQIRGKEGRG